MLNRVPNAKFFDIGGEIVDYTCTFHVLIYTSFILSSTYNLKTLREADIVEVLYAEVSPLVPCTICCRVADFFLFEAGQNANCIV